ncbi:MAG: phosphotransferase, partial [Rhodobacteraceae bacterium]|nr:phosphotransferase [Paracoccaceae bacterium]
MTGELTASQRAFAKQFGWENAHAQALAGDASSRRYKRLTHDNGSTAILMIVPEYDIASLERFRRVSAWLTSEGLNAPDELGCEPGMPFLLIEDFGDDLFATRLDTSPDQARDLYGVATDVLCHAGRATPPDDLPKASFTSLGQTVVEPLEWYPGADLELKYELATAVTQSLKTLNFPDPVFSFRDFHAENIVFCAERSGLAQAGLLDFQDAFLAPIAYDLASLLRDARREISESIRSAMIERFAETAKLNRRDLDRD